MKKNDSFASLLKQLFSNKLFFTLCLLIGFSFSGFGQRSGCDDNAGGLITAGTSCTPSTWDITNNTSDNQGSTACGAGNFDDVWGRFIGNGLPTTITYTPDPGFDAIVSVFSGACGTLTYVACSNSGGNGVAETIVIPTINSTTYRIRIERSGSDANMTGDICVYYTPCNNPASINPITTFASTTATITWPAAAPAPAGGYDYVVSTDNNPGAAGNVATGNTNTTSANVTGLTANTLYYVFVKSNCETNWVGSVQFTTLNTPAITNDECTGAIGLTVNPDLNCGIMTAGSNVGATASPMGDVPNVDGNPDDDVWFSFVATSTQHEVSLENIVTINNGGGLGIAVYDGGTSVNCNALTFVNDSSTEDIVLTGLTINNIYIVRIYGLAPTTFSEQSNFDVCVGTPVPPANDECSGAIVVTVNPDQNCTLLTPGTLNYATDSGINSGCSGNDDDDVWFTFQASGPSHTIELLNNSSSTNLDFTVYANDPCSGSDTPLLCSPAISNTVSGLTTGNTYYVQVYSNASTPQISNFDVCITSPIANDDPCGAINIPINTCIVGSNTGATDSADPNIDTPRGCEPVSANYNGADVWFTTTVGPTGGLQIDLTHIGAPSDFDDGVIALYTGTCSGNLNIVECDDDSGIGSLEPSFTAFGLTPGETVYIRAWEWGAGDEGTFNICVTEVTNPCNSITPIAACGTTINATIPSGNGVFNETPCGSWNVPGEEVIYSFTPTITGNYNITQISAFDHVNYLYSTSCSASGWTCIDDLIGNGQTSSSFPMDSGTTYYIMLDTEITTGGNVSFTLDCPPPPPECGTTFYDTGGISGNYSNNEYEVTTIIPSSPGEVVTVTFTFFDTESCCDDLSIYDGPDATYPLLGTFAGTTLPGTFTSSDPSGALTFVFDSDISFVRGGWAADITCSIPIPNCGETFYDSGGTSNYSNNENNTTTISPDNAGDAVTVTFNSFNTEATNDVLLVYNGSDATAPLLATLSGNLNAALPGPYTSTDPSGELTFVFTSNGSNPQSGWEADVTCSILCNLTIAETLNPIGADACALNYAQLVATTFGSPGGTTPIFSEDFSAGAFPAGWIRVNNSGNTQWIISNSANAGGTANEAMLDWIGGGSGDIGTWSLTSPLIDIDGYTNLELDFKQELDHFSSSYPYSIYIETSLDNATWTVQNSVINVSNDIPPSNVNIDLSSLDGNTNLYLRFRFTGDAFGFFDWSIDDVIVTAYAPPILPQITWAPWPGLYLDAGLTTAYTGGFTDTVYAAPNGTETYTATDQNGCFQTATVTRNKKVWMGYNDNNWYDAGNWLPNGVPTLTDCVLIPDIAVSNVDIPIADEAVALTTLPTPPNIIGFALNLTVAPSASLEIASNTELEVTDWIHLDGTINIRDSGSLIQVNDVANTGNGVMNMQRNAGTVNSYDYIYWSSPADNFNVTDISSATGELIYEWMPTIGTNLNGFGDWRPASGVMAQGKGYIVRGLVNTLPVPANTAQFSGLPRNGTITTPITRGIHITGPYTTPGDTQATNEDDNWNLIGNPYPSAISYADFIADNPYIDGTIYFWTHQNAPSAINSPFYYDFLYNYSDDYIDYNGTGPNPSGFNGDIAAGQAFFVLMLDSPTAGTSENVFFNNNMRNPTLDNSQFYRTTEASNQSSTSIERHRIWLDLINPNEIATSILIGYVEGATNGNDRLFDGYEFESSSISFYSLIEEEKMSIQGRSLPFDETDMVPLGLVIPQSGNYTIAINTIDGLFETESQDIYLEDTYNGIIHDLRINPYSFNSETGTFDDRFILRYTNNALSIEEFETNAGILISAPQNSYIKVTSKIENIKSVSVYDVLGRVLYNNHNINETELIINNITNSDGVLFVKAILINGQQKIHKVIIKQ
ncbi:CUB domain-containing protein [Formosa maritima]|uniref:T9SS sorting signal type C domain-containing protein n=1 Tax=Formosa maritima TaxID=2592046 RepID=A0A5D0GPU9_9FLAO|nr:CUB domain-containing protein [Formosa maritima]TYA59707.1 T9SS sorting signal type C domain-containing protein [Formosa maritima]